MSTLNELTQESANINIFKAYVLLPFQEEKFLGRYLFWSSLPPFTFPPFLFPSFEKKKTLNNFLGMSKDGAPYRADAENYGWIFWIAILEQDAVCASRLNNLGIMVLFKWRQSQRVFRCFAHIFILSRKKKSTSSFGIDPEQP